MKNPLENYEVANVPTLVDLGKLCHQCGMMLTITISPYHAPIVDADNSKPEATPPLKAVEEAPKPTHAPVVIADKPAPKPAPVAIADKPVPKPAPKPTSKSVVTLDKAAPTAKVDQYSRFVWLVENDDGSDEQAAERGAILGKLSLTDLLRINNDFGLGLDTDKPTEEVRAEIVSCF
jgi:outer membrane biosynthesis protein TonB